MKEHEAVFLEEPPAEGFEEMLAGRLPVDDYLRPIDVEYPAFSRAMCQLLQELKAQGKQIFQVEPFLAVLLDIHDFFADGGRPQDLPRDSLLYPVYLAERRATGALLSYYRTVMTGSFEESLECIKQFARHDAARFRLRDSLRAQALERLIQPFSSAYIEAGVIHYPLWRLLRQRVSSSRDLRLVFLADRALSTIGKRGHLCGPGDQLTLLYVFHPDLNQPRRESLLAARALIYAKLIAKDEIAEAPDTMPHVLNELACIRLAARLSLNDCRRLFHQIRRISKDEAYEMVRGFLGD
ncbi:MAG: hypothetical protein JRL30_19035 [Deltaproteobacteria bacterium]|nr:hypothetical protein [Deltaproteobacteria bacterium]